MVRILFFIDRYYPTDHAFVEEVYSKILPDRGYHVTIVARSKLKAQIIHSRWNKAELILLPSRKKYLSDGLAVKQARLLMLDNYDIIQVRNDPLFALLVPSKRFVFQLSHLKAEEFLIEPRKRAVSMVKGMTDLFLRSIYLPKARYVFAISEAMEGFLISKYHIHNSAVVPLGAGVININQPKVDQIKSQYHLNGKTSFIYIGNMASPRRLESVINAFSRANKQVDNELALLLLGDAPHPQDVLYLKQKAKGMSAGNIHFIKRIPRAEVPDYIAACDVGVAAIPINKVTRYSSPTKTLEYLNAGIPVLATAIPDQHQILTESNSGLICDFTVEDMERKMVDFHYCQERKSMGERGCAYVRQNRTYQDIAAIVISCYRRMIEKH